MAGRLQGKVMLITGAGSGLGREVALLAAEEGAKVVVTDKIGARIGPVVAAITAKGGEAAGLKADVTVEGEVEAAVAFARDTFGTLNIAHANAGVTVPGQGSVPFEETTLESWHAVNDVNLTGVFLTIKHAARAMKQAGGGSIVVTSSAASLVAYPGFGIYAAGKAGVNGLVRAAAYELGKYGVRTNAVCPAHGMSVNFMLPPDAPVAGVSYEEAAGTWDPRTTGLWTSRQRHEPGHEPGEPGRRTRVRASTPSRTCFMAARTSGGGSSQVRASRPRTAESAI